MLTWVVPTALALAVVFAATAVIAAWRWRGIALDTTRNDPAVREANDRCAALEQLHAASAARATEVLAERRYLERQCAELAERVSQNLVTLKQQDDFYRHTSDELHVPVAAMVGIAEGLAEKSRAKYDRRFTHDLLVVASTGKRLMAMLANVVDFAALRLGTIALERRAIDLHSLVNVVLTMLGPAISEKRVTVSNDVPPDLYAVFADELRVQQVLVSLLGNAIRVSASGTVVVRATIAASDIELLIADTGAGMRPRALRALLDPHVELSAEPDLDVRTSGLGVRVCKQLIELHGGLFLASSTVGEGSAFGFRLPWTADAASGSISSLSRTHSDGLEGDVSDRAATLPAMVAANSMPLESSPGSSPNQVFEGVPRPGVAVTFRLNSPMVPSISLTGGSEPDSIAAPPQRPTAPPSGGFIAAKPLYPPESPIPASPRMPSSIRQPPSGPGLRSYRALIADDEAINLSLLTQQLEGMNLRVTQASDGATAWDLFEKEGPFDVVLLDVVMPKMNGYEVCRLIRTRFTAAAVPVVMLTGKHDPREFVQGFEAGANDFVTKPFAKKELTMRVGLHLGVAKTNEAFGRFVPRHFLELLGREAIIDVKLGDQVERTIPVLFGDVRGFTPIAEAIGSAETFAFLNSLLSRIGPAIRHQGGFIDKYIGDAFMALFPSSIDGAVRACVAIQREIDGFNAAGLAPLGKPVSLGLGLHVGPMRLGTIGEHERFEATVISDAVNLASRLESLTKVFGVRAIVTENVISAAAGTYEVRHLGAVRVRGKLHSVGVFDLVACDDDEARELKCMTRGRFEEGVFAFAGGMFAASTEAFESVLIEDPSDVAARYYLRLLADFHLNGPPADFDGTLVFLAK